MCLDIRMQLRTTVRLEDDLILKAKAVAARQNRTLTSLIEDGLRLAIAVPAPQSRRKQADFPVSTCTGGTLPGVDISRSSDLLDLLEDPF